MPSLVENSFICSFAVLDAWQLSPGRQVRNMGMCVRWVEVAGHRLSEVPAVQIDIREKPSLRANTCGDRHAISCPSCLCMAQGDPVTCCTLSVPLPVPSCVCRTSGGDLDARLKHEVALPSVGAPDLQVSPASQGIWLSVSHQAKVSGSRAVTKPGCLAHGQSHSVLRVKKSSFNTLINYVTV